MIDMLQLTSTVVLWLAVIFFGFVLVLVVAKVIATAIYQARVENGGDVSTVHVVVTFRGSESDGT